MQPDIILKTDRAGRVRTPRERQEQIIAEWKNSGVSAVRFAETIGVKYQTLAGWIRKYRRLQGTGVGEASPRWLEMAVAPLPTNPVVGLRVELPGGASLVLGDTSQIPLAIQLLRALS